MYSDVLFQPVRSQVTSGVRGWPSVLRGNLRAAGGVFHVYYCTYPITHLYYIVLMAQENKRDCCCVLAVLPVKHYQRKLGSNTSVLRIF